MYCLISLIVKKCSKEKQITPVVVWKERINKKKQDTTEYLVKIDQLCVVFRYISINNRKWYTIPKDIKICAFFLGFIAVSDCIAKPFKTEMVIDEYICPNLESKVRMLGVYGGRYKRACPKCRFCLLCCTRIKFNFKRYCETSS